MYEVRFHGRGGQGAVTAANLIAEAAFLEGKDVQAFPMFGVERRGAPVAAFFRMDEKPIDIKTQIYKPDAVIVLDPTLMDVVNVVDGLKPGGKVLINTKKAPSEFPKIPAGYKIYTVDATQISVDHNLGTITNPIVNTAILGAYVRSMANIKLDSVYRAIDRQIKVKPDDNKKATKAAHDSVKGA